MLRSKYGSDSSEDLTFLWTALVEMCGFSYILSRVEFTCSRLDTLLYLRRSYCCKFNPMLRFTCLHLLMYPSYLVKDFGTLLCLPRL